MTCEGACAMPSKKPRPRTFPSDAITYGRKRKAMLFSVSDETRYILESLSTQWKVPMSRILDMLVKRAEDALAGKFLKDTPR